MEFRDDATIPEMVEKIRQQQGSEDYDLLFSESYSCPVCGYSLPELEPRLFSFNSPTGMCLACDGIGTSFDFDPELLVPNPNKSFLNT